MDAKAEAYADAQTKADADAIEDYWLNWLNEDLRVADAQATSDEDSQAQAKAAATANSDSDASAKALFLQGALAQANAAATAKADSDAKAEALFLLAVKTEGALSDKMKHLLMHARVSRPEDEQ